MSQAGVGNLDQPAPARISKLPKGVMGLSSGSLEHHRSQEDSGGHSSGEGTKWWQTRLASQAGWILKQGGSKGGSKGVAAPANAFGAFANEKNKQAHSSINFNHCNLHSESPAMSTTAGI